MENTCNKSDCPLWEQHKDLCPNYVVGYWKDSNGGGEKRIEDCAPKRILEELKTLHNLVLGMQQTSNEERNASNALAGCLGRIVDRAAQGRILINGLIPNKTELPEPRERTYQVGDGKGGHHSSSSRVSKEIGPEA